MKVHINREVRLAFESFSLLVLFSHLLFSSPHFHHLLVPSNLTSLLLKFFDSSVLTMSPDKSRDKSKSSNKSRDRSTVARDDA